jgi:ABC-2 type transport system permease protein
MMNKLFVWLVGLGNGLWRRLGADPDHLHAILLAKLRVNDRATSFMGRRQQSGNWQQYLLYMLMLFYGAILFVFLFVFEDAGTGMTLSYSVFMVFIGMFLVIDFTEVLIDVRDNYVLVPRPVSNPTLTLGRLLHITIYLGRMSLFLTVVPQAYLLFTAGFWTWLTYALLLIPCLILVIAAVGGLYLLLLRYVSAQRFKEWIGYFQVAFTIVFFALYQLAPQAMRYAKDYADFTLLDQAYVWLLPGAWLAALQNLLDGAAGSLQFYGLALLGVAAPAGVLWAVVHYSDTFARRLVDLGLGAGDESDGEEQPEAAIVTPPADRPRWRERVAGWLTRPGVERSAFRFTWNMMDRSRDFKVRTYPAFGFVPVMFLYFAFIGFGNDDESQTPLAESSHYLTLIYITAYMMISPITQTAFSDKFRAAWIWDAHPNANPGGMRFGRVMAVIGRFFLPTVVVVSTILVAIWGPGVLIHAVLGFTVLLLLTVTYQLIDDSQPFSRELKQGNTANTGAVLGTMLLCGVLGMIHYLVIDRWYFLYPLLVLVITITGTSIYALRKND